MVDNKELLELLRFELKFIEDGGYGRSPRTPWKPSLVFEDSPSCLNFNDVARPHPCDECSLMKFVPKGKQTEEFPCRHIPLTQRGKPSQIFTSTGLKLKWKKPLETGYTMRSSESSG